MPVNIRQRLLDDSKEGQFQDVCQPLEIFRSSKLHVNSAPFCEAIDKELERRRKSALVQERRMQEIGLRPDFEERVLRENDCLRQQLFADLIRQRPGRFTDSAQGE